MPWDEALAVPVFSLDVLAARFTLNRAVEVNKLYRRIVAGDTSLATRTRQTYNFWYYLINTTYPIHVVMCNEHVIHVRCFTHINNGFG